MLRRARQILLNFSPGPGIRTLGVSVYAAYLAALFRNGARIWKARNLSPLDAAMGRRFPVIDLKHEGRSFKVDLGFSDSHLTESSSSFGAVREHYLRNCYLRGLPPGTLKGIRTFVDLGANRGIFSCLMTAAAKRIICVEPQGQYNSVIERNMGVNGFRDFTIINAFVGTAPKLDGASLRSISMIELMAQSGIDRIDLLKVDIEGGEFELFRAPEWLDRVGFITMEIHPEWGDPAKVKGTLEERGWSVTMVNRLFQPASASRDVEFIYAINPTWNPA